MNEVLSIKIPEELLKKLDRMAKKRRVTRSKLCQMLLQGAACADEIDMEEGIDADELRLARHFHNMNLLQDLQYLGPKMAELTNRELDSVVLFYRDKGGRLPHLIHQFRMDGNGGFAFTAHVLSILGYCSHHLLPKALKQRLGEWAIKMGGQKTSTDIGLALTVYLSKLYQPAEIPDTIGAEINQEFEEAIEEASKQEAFNRTTR
jgi:hypothetical protein